MPLRALQLLNAAKMDFMSQSTYTYNLEVVLQKLEFRCNLLENNNRTSLNVDCKM
jgi:hypothetical protein